MKTLLHKFQAILPKSLFIIILILSFTNVHSQMYILNEDFSSAEGTTPPIEWSNITMTGVANDLWHFDNPGNQNVGFPIVAPFAIFDAAAVSDNGQSEEVALETPSFDASVSNYIILEFDHTYIPGNNSLCKIQAYNGTDWFDVITYDNSISEITHEIVDISTYVGGITNAKLRFTWSGEGSGYWAMDNVRIYGALPVDAGIVSIDNPVTPVAPGTQEVKVMLGNFGYNPLTSVLIKWTANGLPQPDFSWNGNIPFSGVVGDISIGTYDFQDAVYLQIWSENPNGQGDPNPYNDTISVMLHTALCGTYTIGGTNPDFASFTEVANVLNIAGISCPVIFKVRDGVYNEQIILNNIQGSSEQNTITFESESGDSSAVIIQYNGENTIHLKQVEYINFKRLGFQDNRGIAIDDYSKYVNVENCYFQNSNIGVITGSQDINITNNLFSNVSYPVSCDNARNVVIDKNQINNCRYGIRLSQSKDSEVKNNRIITRQSGSSTGIEINYSDTISVFNNYIYTGGTTRSIGLQLYHSSHCEIYFNSINITNTDIGQESIAILLTTGDNNIIKNNIFNIKEAGYPIYIYEGTQNFTLDYNDYYSPSELIGRYNNTDYYDLDDWRNAIGQDSHSLAENPFYTSNTDLSMNQVLLNNVGLHITGIDYDIDGTLRNAAQPDLGAKEYNPCQPDAGINRITAPGNPVAQGDHDIKVVLQNQGSGSLSSVTINWKVNDELQTPFSWTGNLSVNENLELSIGNYNFQGGFYLLTVWTTQPNGAADCNSYNDTTQTDMGTSLCGEYTIGGVNPDFANFTEVANVLNIAGISCPVIFKVRDGVYNEQIVLNSVQGSSEQNTITFESESGDSSAVIIQYNGENTIHLKQVEYINFKRLGFQDNRGIAIDDYSKYVNVENCYFQNSNIGVITGSQDINITNNLFSNVSYPVSCDNARNVVIDKNQINNCRYGIRLSQSKDSEVKNNRIITRQSGSSTGIEINYSDTISVFNNYIYTGGTTRSIGLQLYHSSHCEIYFNSINITNTDIGQESIAILLTTGDNNIIKNNIFNIKEAGYPIYIYEGTQNFTLDYNDYYSPSELIGRYNNVDYYDLDDWGEIINGDANSKDENPYFASDSIPLPYQRILNGAGIPVQGILLDINGKIRNDLAPDMGCIEFMVDFGVTDLISPNLDCFHNELDSVIVYLRQFGDIPFIDLQLAYQVNGGEVHYDMVPGTIYNDLIFTFSETVNISEEGEYHFKVWLINALDDNINNDTLRTIRYSKPVPILTSSYNNDCSWKEVYFTGSAQIADPYFIESYEWYFGDSTVSYQQNPIHMYENTGWYDVVFRAYSNAGCYSEETLQVFIEPNYNILEINLDIINEVCKGDGTGSVDIMASGGNQPYSYFINGELIESNHVSHIPSGNYTFMVRDAQQCETSIDTVIYPAIFMNPIISAEPDSGFAPLIVDFDFTSIDASLWSWDFGDGETSTQTAIEHTFSTYGEHTIVLTVNSGEPYLCVETDTVTIFVDINIIIEINNVFTPNGDGLNDYFEVRTDGISDMNAKIYDQWGSKVYEIAEVNGKWDGLTEGGKEAPEGTYFYYVVATSFGNTNHERHGSVMLLRDDSEVYPNPAKGVIKLKPGGMLSGTLSIYIYNLEGSLILSTTQETSEEISIDISILHNGVYILKVCDTDNCIYKKLIKE